MIVVFGCPFNKARATIRPSQFGVSYLLCVPKTLSASPLTPGMRVLCRDAEWLVTRVHSVDFTTGSQIAFCTAAGEMVRGHEAA